MKPNYKIWAAYIGVFLIALALRLALTSWTGLTTDEANGIAIAESGSWSDLIHRLKDDGNPPLIYAATKIVCHVVGESEVPLKVLSILLSSFSVSVIQLILSTIIGPGQACLAALMLALCPPVVRFGTMVRPYCLMPLFSLASTWLAMRILSGEKGRLLPAAYGLTTAAMVYCHYWGAFVAAGQAVLAATGFLRRWFTRAAVVAWLSGAGFSLVLFAPWLPVVIEQGRQNLSPWAEPPTLYTLAVGAFAFMFAGPEYSMQPQDQYAILVSNAVVLLAVLCPQSLAGSKAERGQNGSAGSGKFAPAWWKVVAVSGLFAGVLTSFVKPILRDRYLVSFTPLFVVVIVSALCAFTPRLRFLPRLLILAAIWLPIWLPQYRKMLVFPETSTRAIADEITGGVKRDKDLVVIAWQSIAPAVLFYLPDDVPATTFPDLGRNKYNCWRGMTERLNDPKKMDALFARMDGILRSGGRIWLIDRARDIKKPVSDRLENVRFVEVDMRRMDEIRDWLGRHAALSGTNRIAPGRDFNVYLSLWVPKGQAAPEPAAPESPGLSLPPPEDDQEQVAPGDWDWRR